VAFGSILYFNVFNDTLYHSFETIIVSRTKTSILYVENNYPRQTSDQLQCFCDAARNKVKFVIVLAL